MVGVSGRGRPEADAEQELLHEESKIDSTLKSRRIQETKGCSEDVERNEWPQPGGSLS